MKKLNSIELKEFFISGANNLSNNFKAIDALNVFPIPDGDTGTNMMMTIQSGVKNITSLDTSSCGELATNFSRGLLLGARGNSGVILSQIFRGFGESVAEKQELVLVDIVEAFKKGVERAYKAVLKPTEGTMLTVIREASEELEKVSQNNKDLEINKAISAMIERAKESLENTPNLLPVLKEANVVDSGGAGIVKILEGFLKALNGDAVELSDSQDSQEIKMADFDNIEDDEDAFGYCTEFVMRLLPDVEGKIPFDQDTLKEFLLNVGVSVVLVSDGDIVKVHVHTYKPGDVFNFAQQYGEFITIKVENMDEQHQNLTVKKENRKKQAIVTVAVGQGLTNLFTQLRADIVISGGQTMNPSIEDFVKAITKLNPESVIILPNNSNIVMSAKQAAEILNAKGIVTKIVPTTSIQQGISACMGFNPELDIEENLIEMFAATKRVTCGQITTAVRDSRLNGVTIKSGDYLGIKEKKIISSSKDINKVAASLVDSMMHYDAEIITVIAGCDINKKNVKALCKYIEEKYPQVEVEIQQGDQPVYYLLLAVE